MSAPEEPIEQRPAMTLDHDEAAALALRLVARHVADPDWLAWEDVPELAEESFNRLSDAVDAIAGDLHQQSLRRDHALDIDSADLHARAS